MSIIMANDDGLLPRLIQKRFGGKADRDMNQHHDDDDGDPLLVFWVLIVEWWLLLLRSLRKSV